MALSRLSPVFSSSTGIGVPVPVVVMLIPPVAVAQYSIVQEQLLARNASQGIVLEPVLWCGTGREADCAGATRKVNRGPRGCQSVSGAAQPPVPLPGGGTAGPRLALDTSRLRWAQAMILARMRSPSRTVCRCPAAYAGGAVLVEPFGTVLVFRRLSWLFFRILSSPGRQRQMVDGPVIPCPVWRGAP